MNGFFRTLSRGFFSSILLIGLVTGCGPTKALTPFRESASFPDDVKPVVALEPPLPVVPEDPPIVVGPRRPVNILALSGGGSYGAHTAGVLIGWSRSNSRPDFDVVTGISTGALIAPLAFLGSKYDAQLQQAYTEVRRKDVFTLRNVVTIPFQDSVATSAPLRKVVDSLLTEEAMLAIAEEHRKGKRLYIATTQLETKRNVVWDIGAIASNGGSENRKLICDILVASTAVPGVFPPVPIQVERDGKKHTELHVDGGVTSPVFVPPAVIDAAVIRETPSDVPPPANLYVIMAGKYYPGSKEVRPRLFKVIRASGAALLSSHARRDVSNIYHMATLNGVKFHSLALRQDFPIEDSALDFNQATMSQLFSEGVRVGVGNSHGPKWDSAPPDRGAGDAGDIRTGIKLPAKP